MRFIFTRLIASMVLLGVFAFSVSAMDAENTMLIELKDGTVEIALRPDIAPKHVEQIKTLIRNKEYDNVVFHRVIDGFMAQTGDVQFGDKEDGFNLARAGTGGSNLDDIPAEFTSEASFKRGAVGMARSASPNSANSQFFIMFDAAPHLDGQYTIVGDVTKGMELVDAIKRGAGGNGEVSDPDHMISVRIAADQ